LKKYPIIYPSSTNKTFQMNKLKLVAILASKQPHTPPKDIELAVDTLVKILTDAIAGGTHVEIRGFCSFSTLPRRARNGRNPRTGEAVRIPARQVVQFKAGLDLRKRVAAARLKNPISRDL
jgi:integration host factor subunit beta